MARRRTGAVDRDAERRPRLVAVAMPPAERNGRAPRGALAVTGSLAIPTAPLPWEAEVLAAYATSLLDDPDRDDAQGPRA